MSAWLMSEYLFIYNNIRRDCQSLPIPGPPAGPSTWFHKPWVMAKGYSARRIKNGTTTAVRECFKPQADTGTGCRTGL
jgi:hypothetical protein